MTARRTPSWGPGIDRTRPIWFTFDGQEVAAFVGDTIASAILANGIEAPFRSPILGRPRGVISAGAEEPNAFVEISEPWFESIVAATMVDVVDGMVVGSRPGVGHLRGDAPRGRPIEHRNAHVELLVVGSGHDGFYPARDAAARGERVMLVEQHRTIERGAGGDFRAEGVTYLTRATALGLYDDGYVTVLEQADELDRLWHVRAKRVILATGAFERSIAFADNDRPGVMLSHAALLYLDYGVLVGSRTVVFTARGGAYGVASNLVALGGDVRAIADVSGSEANPGTRRTPSCCAAGSSPGPRATGGSRRSISRGPTVIDGRSSAIRSSCRAAGTRTSRCGGRSAAASGSTTRSTRSSRRRGRPGCRSWARRPARCRTTHRTGSSRARTPRGTSSTSSATRRSRTSPLGLRGAALRRARQARHVHRHGYRSGPHERRHHRRGRERAPRRVAGMAGTLARSTSRDARSLS